MLLNFEKFDSEAFQFRGIWTDHNWFPITFDSWAYDKSFQTIIQMIPIENIQVNFNHNLNFHKIGLLHIQTSEFYSITLKH